MIETIEKFQNIVNQEYSKEVLGFFSECKEYSDESLSLKHAKTPPFWMKYVKLMHLIHHYFSRSKQMEYFDAYISTIPRIKN